MPSFLFCTKISVAVFLAATLIACQSSQQTVTPALTETPLSSPTLSPDYLYGTANVESAEAEIITNNGPTHMKIRIRGLLNDGATTIDQIQTTRVSDGFVVTVTTARLKSAIASLALVPFEREITIDLISVPSGSCQVRVNDIRITTNIP